ncbi:hypothetical protein GCM10027194_24320 [Thalassiella azotivora]
MLASLSSLLLLTTLCSAYLLVVTQPAVDRLTETTRQVRTNHQAMLDQETGLRAWLATGDEAYLEPFRRGRVAGERSREALVAQAEVSGPLQPSVVAEVVDLVLAAQQWQDWADEVLAGGPVTADPERLGTVLADGRTRFDDYRGTSGVVTGAVVAHRDDALQRQRTALAVTTVAYLVTFAAAVALVVRRRRNLVRAVEGPVEVLLGTIDALRGGDLTAQAAPSGVRELDAVGVALSGLAGGLRRAGEEQLVREQRTQALVQRLETVVRVTREVSGSLSVRYVTESVASAAAELTGARATLWLPGQDGRLRAVRRSDDPHGNVPPSELAPPEVVARAAADARAGGTADTRAYPLVLAGMVVGVLEVADARPDPDAEQVLEALLSSAAGALESARLHSETRELAEVDALTQLANRRRLETDLASEWDRCRRYERPLSVVMVDLDHFKRLNDTEGHAVGDVALRAVAATIAAALRSTDTAYRYGGEEIVVLLRETPLDEAVLVAERLRAAVAGTPLLGTSTTVTASLGVATLADGMLDARDLVAAADAALYTAKRQGRDRVVAATALTTT